MAYNIPEKQSDLLELDIEEALCSLTPLERDFMLEYFKDQNASAAARRVPKTRGGGERTQPAQLGFLVLNRPHVRKIANAYTIQKLATLDATVDRILSECATVAFANISHYVSWEGNVIIVKDMDDIPPTLLPAIKKITRVDTSHSTRIEVELHDKNRALEMLGKYHTMFKEKLDIDAHIGGVLRVPAPQSPEEWESGA